MANLYDDATWEYCHEGDTQWLLTRTRSTDSYVNEGHQGEMSYTRYSRLENSIQRITEEIEEERRRLEEERRRREEEERTRRNTANANISKAIEQAKNALASSDFERAEATLAMQAAAYNRYKNELNITGYEQLEGRIQTEKRAWMNERIGLIQKHISAREWDEAKTKIDALKPERVSATGVTSKVQTLRDRLNKEKEEWEEAEKERLRLEKIANEKRAKEIVLQHLDNWSPNMNNKTLLSKQAGFEAFLESLMTNDDWLFCKEHDAWMGGKEAEAWKRKANTLYDEAKETHFHTTLSELVANQVTRENILADQILAGEHNPMVHKEMEQVLRDGIAGHFAEVNSVLEFNQFKIPKAVVENFTIQFVDARSAYIEEQIKLKNTEFAKAMVGKALKLQDGDDFVSMVASSYIGQHTITMYVTENGMQRKVEKMEEMVQHIEAGNNMIIVLEECYDTDVEQNQGHIKDSKIFE